MRARSFSGQRDKSREDLREIKLTLWNPTVIGNITKTKLTTPDNSYTISVLVEKTPGVYEATAVYDPPANATFKDKTTLGYIESSEGRTFKVTVEDNRTYQQFAIVAALYLDGTFMESYILDPTKGDKNATFVGRRESPTTIRPFNFAKLQLTDDDATACVQENVVKSMGTIAVKICRVSVGPRVPDLQTHYTAAPNAAILHERSKKAQLSHQTGLAPAIAVQASPRTSVSWIDTYEAPMLTLELAYRSRTLLELNDIVPYAAPAPVLADDDPAAGPSNPKKRGAAQVITIDDSDDEAPKVKKEKGIKKEGGVKKEKIKGEKVVLDID